MIIFTLIGLVLLSLGGSSGVALLALSIRNSKKLSDASVTLWLIFILGAIAGKFLGPLNLPGYLRPVMMIYFFCLGTIAGGALFFLSISDSGKLSRVSGTLWGLFITCIGAAIVLAF